MDDAAAVGGSPDRHVVEPEPVEDRGDRPDHVGGAEDVAAEIEDDLVRLDVAPRRGQTPRPLPGQRGEVVGQRDLTEVLTVVVRHGRSLGEWRSRCQRGMSSRRKAADLSVLAFGHGLD